MTVIARRLWQFSRQASANPGPQASLLMAVALIAFLAIMMHKFEPSHYQGGFISRRRGLWGA